MKLNWIRLNYTNQYSPSQLPVVITKNRYAYGVIALASTLIGITGSLIVEGIGWEKALKFIHHTSFGVTDPMFNMDISFYIFELPFIQFILYTLLNLFFFFLLIQIVAYSFFNIYLFCFYAQIYLACTVSVFVVL